MRRAAANIVGAGIFASGMPIKACALIAAREEKIPCVENTCAHCGDGSIALLSMIEANQIIFLHIAASVGVTG